MKVALVANTSWYLFNFRRNLASALRASRHDIVTIAGPDDYADRLRAEGLRHIVVPFSGSGVNPIRELRTLLALRRALRIEKVDVVLSYTPKGNIYTALATLGGGVRLIPNVSGLGRAFIQGGWLGTLVRLLYRLTMRRASCVFFQNADDRALFVRQRLVAAPRALLVPGSGVDLTRFAYAPPPDEGQGLRFLLVARLIWDKGLAEFVQAARAARRIRPDLHFAVLGALDTSPRRGATREEIARWTEEGTIEYLGMTDDVRPEILRAHCVVLPSYREGVPRSLLEAAAMGRPVIATDVAGCKDVVEPGHNGLLCRPRDPQHLTEKILEFAGLPADTRHTMGANGRRKAELEFDEGTVIGRYLEALGQLR